MAGAAHEREGFLDAIRTLAVLRVIIWHAFGAAVITYFVSAVPAMFFVTGSLLARSIDRHGGPRTILDRLRRMLVPLWLFTAVAFCVMAVAARIEPGPATTVPKNALASWLIPLVDPKGSPWEAGWLSSPLWYLRALLWIVLSAPLLLRVVRRAPATTFTVLLVAVFGLDLAARHPAWPLQQTRAPWIIGDFALYAIFVSLGFLHRDGRLAQLGRGVWAAAAITGGVGGAAWVLTQPVHNGVVNDSHPAHLLIGFAWLSLSLALAPHVERVAATRPMASLIKGMNSRSMTVYLWHSAAIITAYQLLWRIPFKLPYGLFSVSLLALTAVGTVALVTAFGWIEDLAAQRSSALWPAPLAAHPRRSGTIAFAGAALFALVGLSSVALVPLDAASAATVSRPPAPSQQPPTPVLTATTTGASTFSSSLALSAVSAASSTSQTAAVGDATTNTAMTQLISRWLATTGVEGAQVAVARNGTITWSGAVGTSAAGKALTVNDSFDTWSITKTFTASLIYQLVDRGQLTLDGPLPKIASLPKLDTSGLTLRMLLNHSTGLMPYRDTRAYLANPNSITDVMSAMAAVLAEPRQFTPGTKRAYSSSNYLVLGLLLEQVTGKSYDQLLSSSILEPLGLHSTTHAAATPGNPNFSTGGVITDVADLATWAYDYLALHKNISDASWAAATTIDPTSALGAGVIGYCPCIPNSRGATDFAAIGFGGSTTEIEYAASDHTAIAINITQSIWDPGTRYQDVVDLFGAIRVLVDAQAARG